MYFYTYFYRLRIKINIYDKKDLKNIIFSLLSLNRNKENICKQFLKNTKAETFMKLVLNYKKLQKNLLIKRKDYHLIKIKSIRFILSIL